MAEVEPRFPGYTRTLAALRHYLDISHPNDGEKLTVPSKTLEPGDRYDGVVRLTRLLQLLGKALRHETPVFEEDMRFVLFRPYWNVPPSIQRSELVPAIRRDANYVANQNYEIVTRDRQVVAAGRVSGDATKARAKRRPWFGKFMFPNEHHVYLHSTPSQQLFGRSRRDFSHGCIRVERPTELAAWVLKDHPEWNLERIRTAMQGGKDDFQVNPTKPFPVLILYGTAVVDEEGRVHFFDDLYGHDAALEKLLAKGYPCPG